MNNILWKYTVPPTQTHHQLDVFDLPDANVDLLALVHGQADVEQVVLVGHAAQLHEGQEVTVVVAALVLIVLEENRSEFIPRKTLTHGVKFSLSSAEK